MVNGKILDYKVEKYTKEFGENALIEAIKDQDNKYTHFGRNDYIDLVYYKDDIPHYMFFCGDVLEFADYIIAKINSKYEIFLIRRINGIFEPLKMYGIEEYI